MKGITTKRVIATLLAALLLLVTAVGCSGSPSSGKDMTIEWWNLWDPEIADQMIADFEAEFPNIKINRTQHGDPGIWEAMVVATATRSGPDVFFNWSGAYQQSFFRKGGAISLNEYSAQYGWDKRLSAAAADLVTYDGHLTLIPYSFGAVGVVYKNSTFEQFGLSEPTSYAEMTMVCNTLVENGVLPYVIGGIDTWHTMGWVDAVLEQFCGPELHDRLNDIEDTGVSWNCPEVIAAYAELSEWVSRGWVNPNFAGVGESETLMPIFDGSGAMNVTGSWQEGSITDAGFDTADFGFFPFPRDGGEGRLATFVDGLALCDFNGKDATDAAAEFLNFLLLPESVDKYITIMGIFSGVNDAPIADSAALLHQISGYMVTRDAYDPSDGILPEEVVDVFLSQCAEVILGSLSPEEAALRMANAMDSARANAE